MPGRGDLSLPGGRGGFGTDSHAEVEGKGIDLKAVSQNRKIDIDEHAPDQLPD